MVIGETQIRPGGFDRGGNEGVSIKYLKMVLSLKM